MDRIFSLSVICVSFFCVSFIFSVNCIAGVGDAVPGRIVKDVSSEKFVVKCGQRQRVCAFMPPEDFNVFIQNDCPVTIPDTFIPLGGQRYKFSISRNFTVGGLDFPPHNSWGRGENCVFWHYKWGWEYRLVVVNEELVLRPYTVEIDVPDGSCSLPCVSHSI